MTAAMMETAAVTDSLPKNQPVLVPQGVPARRRGGRKRKLKNNYASKMMFCYSSVRRKGRTRKAVAVAEKEYE